LTGFLFRQGVQDFRGSGAATVLLDDLGKEDDASLID